MPIGTFRAAGSGLFPLILGLLLMALSAVLLITVLTRRKPVRHNRQAPEGGRSTRQVLLFMGAIVLATLLLRHLGYPLVSFLLLLALLRILGVTRWAYNVTLSFFTAAGTYVLFVLWLQIPLPKGWIGL